MNQIINLFIAKRRDLYIKIQLEDQKKLISFYSGVTCLTAIELIENSSLYKYVIDEMIYPLHHQNYLSNSITNYLPHSDIFWVSSHFLLNSLSFPDFMHFHARHRKKRGVYFFLGTTH